MIIEIFRYSGIQILSILLGVSMEDGLLTLLTFRYDFVILSRYEVHVYYDGNEKKMNSKNIALADFH